jgi:DNA-binding SARP family transcriptional activator
VAGDEPRTTIRLCGRLRFELDGEELSARLPGGQGLTVLTYLIANRDRAPDRAELVDVLWPYQPPKDPQGALRPILSRLRGALAPATLEGRDRIEVVLPEPVWIDIEEAGRLLGEARTAADAGDWAGAVAAARRVRELLGGDFLPADDSEWVEDRRRELADLEVEALELSARGGLAAGGTGPGEAERASRELIERSPYRESGYQLLMEALAADGNPAEALRVYERLRQLLRDELGTSPAPELQQLHTRLLEGDGARVERPAAPAEPEHRRVPLPPLLSPRMRGAFVGRDDELRTLTAAWERARSGSRELAFLAGEPGIGKTRLASEFAVQAQVDGTVLYAACPQETVLPYQALVEALRHYARTHSDAIDAAALGPGAAELARLIPELAASVGGDGVDAGADPETRRYMMFDAVAAFLAQASAAAPILLVLDDLHWADPPTLRLLQHVVGSQRGASLLVLGTYREGEVTAGHPLAAVLAELRRTTGFERVRLAGLDERELGALVTFYAGSEAPPPLLQTLRDGTDGNPFFVEEVMRNLIEKGTLFIEDGRWRSSLSVDELGVPTGVEEVLISRVGRLSDPASTALRHGSVLGREFGFDELRVMVDLDEEDLIAAMEEALAAQLVVEEPSKDTSRYSFTHALVREGLYRGMARPRRARMHARAAAAIASTRGDSGDAEVAALALHYRLAGDAGDLAKAIEYSLRAGQRAFELLAWDEAVAHWDGAVTLLDRTDGDLALRVRLLVGLSDLMVVAGDAGGQISYLERALVLCERLEDPRTTAKVHSKLGMSRALIDSIYAEFLDIGEAFRHFDAAREVLDQGPVSAARGHLAAGVGCAYTYAFRIRDAIETSLEAMAIADQVGDELLWVAAAELNGWHNLAAGNLGAGFAVLDRAFAIATDHGHPYLAWQAANMCGQYTWGLGDPDGAEAHFERALALPYIERTSYRQTLADSFGRCHLVRGELEEARRHLSDANPAWFSHSLKPLLDLWEGRWGATQELAREVRDASRRTDNRWDGWAADLFEARVLALRGKHEAAGELFERAFATISAGGGDYYETWVGPELAGTLVETGRVAEARDHVERCLEILARGEDWRGRAGPVAVAHAVVLSAEGRGEEAAVSFERALEAFERFKLRCDAAEAMGHWGRALARAGDAAGAADRLDEAAERLRECGAGEPYLEAVALERAALTQ